jgi:hypothetical protein
VVKNGSTKPINTGDVAVELIASQQDTDAVQYTKIPTNQIPSAGTVLPGRSVNGTYGFIIRKSDVGHLQAEVWAGQSEPHAIFDVSALARERADAPAAGDRRGQPAPGDGLAVDHDVLGRAALDGVGGQRPRTDERSLDRARECRIHDQDTEARE